MSPSPSASDLYKYTLLRRIYTDLMTCFPKHPIILAPTLADTSLGWDRKPNWMHNFSACASESLFNSSGLRFLLRSTASTVPFLSVAYFPVPYYYVATTSITFSFQISVTRKVARTKYRGVSADFETMTKKIGLGGKIEQEKKTTHFRTTTCWMNFISTCLVHSMGLTVLCRQRDL